MNDVIEMPHVTNARRIFERYVLDMGALYLSTCNIFEVKLDPIFEEFIELSEDGQTLKLLKSDTGELKELLCTFSLAMADLICYRCLGESPISEKKLIEMKESNIVH